MDRLGHNNRIVFLIIFLIPIYLAPGETNLISSKKITKSYWDLLSQNFNFEKLKSPESGFVRDVEEKEGEEEEIVEEVKSYKIGGLFDKEDSMEEIAFKLAIERYNKNNEASGSKFIAQINYLPSNSYLASAKVCEILQENVAAILGPSNKETASHVQSICDAFEIVHIETNWDHQIRRENYLVNLAPHPETLSRAYSDLVESFEWISYIIIYENEEGLYKYQDLLKYSVPSDRQTLLIQLPPGDDYKEFLREHFENSDYDKVILDCHSTKIYTILKQSQQIGILNSKISFIFTSLDLHTVDLEDFKYSGAEIIAMRLIDPDRNDVKETLKNWHSLTLTSEDEPHRRIFKPRKRVKRQEPEEEIENPAIEDNADAAASYPAVFTTEIALIYDAVELLGNALSLLNSIQDVQTRPLHCDSSNTWQQGYSVINYMKMEKIQGLTGWIQFNTTGFRTDVSLDVIQLKESGLEKIGVWDSKFVNKFKWMEQEKEVVPTHPPEADGRPSLKGKTLVVTTIVTAPLTMWKISETPLTGNDRYEGFAVDLLEKLSEYLNFNYIIKPVNDGKYGSPDKKGEWNGMIRELMDGVADIAVADLTINKMRQGAVDFTMPFMSLGISILYVVPSVKPPSLLSFMQPMAPDVWVLVALALFGTSVVLYLCARLTPFEWIVPHPCIDDPDELENEFTLRNCFFFTLGTYLCQGADIAPKTASTRIIAGFWWLFTLIMVSSYTANLATFLIVQDLDISIKELADLPAQTKAKYGCLGSGTTATFFRTSPFPTHQAVWNNMVKFSKTDKEIFVSSNKQGVDRVARDGGGFAFFMESTAIEYNMERNCKLSQVGGLLDNKGYGIGLKKGSNFTQAFSSGILKLQEKGVLDEIKRKWWKEERKDNACAEEGDGEEEGSVQPLTLANVGGVFIILVLGCIIACVFACFELIWSAKELSDESNESIFTEIANEVRFAFSCQGTTKEVRKKPGTPSVHSQDDEDKDNESETSNGSKDKIKDDSPKPEPDSPPYSPSAPRLATSVKESFISGSLQVKYKPN